MGSNNNNRNKGELGRSVQVLLGIMILSVLIVITVMIIKTISDEGTDIISMPSEQTTTSSQETTQETTTTETTTTTTTSTAPSSEDTSSTSSVPDPVVDLSFFDDAVFVGDSITYGLSSYGKLDVHKVLAAQGMNISKINTSKIATADYGNITILDAIQRIQPKKVYIMIGSNGIAWLSLDYMVENYRTFVADVLTADPECDIHIISIPPVSASWEFEPSPIVNSDVDSYNSKLKEMANELGVDYIDFNSILKDDSGNIKSEYVEGDGMHFKGATYDLMLKYVIEQSAN